MNLFAFPWDDVPSYFDLLCGGAEQSSFRAACLRTEASIAFGARRIKGEEILWMNRMVEISNISFQYGKTVVKKRN